MDAEQFDTLVRGLVRHQSRRSVVAATVAAVLGLIPLRAPQTILAQGNECSMPGYKKCGSSCVDLSTDEQNCGSCYHTCPGDQKCQSRSCSCAVPGHKLCGSRCVNLQIDDSNCGRCGGSCFSGQHCFNGHCSDDEFGGAGAESSQSEDGNELTTYTGQAYGWEVSLDPTWRVMDSLVADDGQRESLQLFNGTSTIIINVNNDFEDATAAHEWVRRSHSEHQAFRGMTLVAEEEDEEQSLIASVSRLESSSSTGWLDTYLFVTCKPLEGGSAVIIFYAYVPAEFVDDEYPKTSAVYDSLRPAIAAPVECVANGEGPCLPGVAPCCDGTCIQVPAATGLIDGMEIMRCWDGVGPNPSECRGFGEYCGAPPDTCCPDLWCAPDVTGFDVSRCEY